MMIVGLMGAAGAGKDTVAEALEFGLEFEHRKFAAPLRNMMRSLLRDAGVSSDIRERMVDGDLKEIPTPSLFGQSPRYAMQTLGTEWGRNYMGSDFWASIATADLGSAPGYVFSDVRFPNEYAAIRDRGGLIVRIVRYGAKEVEAHASETALAGFGADLILINPGRDVVEFQAQARAEIERRLAERLAG